MQDLRKDVSGCREGVKLRVEIVYTDGLVLSSMSWFNWLQKRKKKYGGRACR